MQLRKENKLLLNFVKTHVDAVAPSYAHEGDAGMDLSSVEDVIILPGGRALISTGISIQIRPGYVGLVHPRSGLANNHGVTVLNAPGTVDSGYRGEIKVNLINLGSKVFRVAKGDRIAQIVFHEFTYAIPNEVLNLEDSVRGTGGLGSTGGINASRI
mgnify:CR=1 FL=1